MKHRVSACHAHLLLNKSETQQSHRRWRHPGFTSRAQRPRHFQRRRRTLSFCTQTPARLKCRLQLLYNTDWYYITHVLYVWEWKRSWFNTACSFYIPTLAIWDCPHWRWSGYLIIIWRDFSRFRGRWDSPSGWLLCLWLGGRVGEVWTFSDIYCTIFSTAFQRWRVEFGCCRNVFPSESIYL